MVISMNRWKGKVAIVTGASAGIGLEVSKLLVENGVTVVGFARRVDKMKEGMKNCTSKGFHAVKVDMTKEEDIIQGFKWTCENVGPISILINNAGLLTNTSLSDGDATLWKKILDTNVLGLSIATREAIRSMKKNNIQGHIININSVLGHKINFFPNSNMYPASKFAVTALTESLRMELNFQKDGIKVTSVSPGAVATEFIDASEHKMDKEFLKSIPFLKPESVAETVIFALSTPPDVVIAELTVKALGEN